MPAAKVRVNYEELGAIEHQFYDQAEAVDKLVCTLQNMLDHLRANWTGENADAFFKEMDHAVLPPLDRLMRALKQAGAATREVSAIFQEGEEEAAAFFKGDAWVGGASGALSGALPGIFGGAGGGSLPGGFAGGGGGGGGGGAFGDEKKPLKLEKFPMTLISGTRAEVFARVAAGQMTPQQAADLLKKMQSSPFDPRWSDYIKGKVTFFSESTGTEQALLDGTLSSDLGSVRGSLLGYETKASAWGGIDKSGLGISGTLSGSVYAARLRESLTVGDLNVTTDTSLLSADAQLKGQLSVSRQGVSAEASAGVNAYLFNSRVDAHIGGLDAALQADAGVMLDGKVKAAVNPLNGDLGVSAEGNAFVGIRERAQATYTMGFLKVGVQGELDQGVGVGGKAKVGFEKGVFRFDVGAYASDGIGAGGGVIVEIDAVEAGKQVVEWAEAGIDWMFGH